VWHSIKGLKNSPRGERISGMMHSVKLRSPALGGAFAAFGGIFSTLDCVFVNIRKKEDPWNAIMSGAGASGILAARGITCVCLCLFALFCYTVRSPPLRTAMMNESSMIKRH
jgi:drug/metabolite transporter superfamily protein YnfA